MASHTPQNTAVNGTTSHEGLEKSTSNMTQEERTAALHAAKFGYGPLAHIGTNDAKALLPGKPAKIHKQD